MHTYPSVPSGVRLTTQQSRNERGSPTARLLNAYRDGGDARARERLVALYLPLVEALAHRHKRHGIDHDALLEAGSLGLLQAIDRFDPRLGEEFAAFAVPTIAAEIKQQEARSGHTATDESGLDSSESPLLLADTFRTLDEAERTIIYLRYVEDRSRREVAKELRMSPSALTRRTTSALSKLRRELEGRAFDRGAQTAAPERATTEPSPAPEPKSRTGHSGRLMLRMPQSLHAELARAAEREDVSLNQYITNTLSASLHWHASDDRAASSPRWLPAAIVTNIVVVVIAGLVALTLLLVAWQQGW